MKNLRGIITAPSTHPLPCQLAFDGRLEPAWVPHKYWGSVDKEVDRKDVIWQNPIEFNMLAEKETLVDVDELCRLLLNTDLGIDKLKNSMLY